MSETKDPDAQTEEASEKRLSDAAAKGQVAFSREIAVFASAGAVWVALAYLMQDAGARVAIGLRPLLEHPGGWSLGTVADLSLLLRYLLTETLAPLLPVLGVVAAAGLAASLAQSRGAALERIRPQASRISPRAGWKRIFGRAGLGNAVKSLAGLLVVGGVAAVELRQLMRQSIGLNDGDPGALMAALPAMAARLVLVMLAAMAALAGLDLALARLNFRRGLRMTPQEVKEEAKEADGDPRIKGRMRMLARRRLRKRMMAAVPRATVVITNPTHYAVALRYVRGETHAPLMVAKGTDLIALKIREIAAQHGIPVVEDRALARALHASVPVDASIPPELYKAVARIILFVKSASARTAANG